MMLVLPFNWKPVACSSRAVSRLLWCIILLLSFCFSCQWSPQLNNDDSASFCNQRDMHTLLDFKTKTSSSKPLNWQPYTNCCNWEGVTCKDNRVIKLWMPLSGLKGSLSSSFGSLDQLMELNFSYNHLNGTVPNELFSLQNLQVLDLSFNNLSGPLPTPKGLYSIQSINVSSNHFSDKLPHLGILSNLISLNVSNNSFTGSIPTYICRNLISIRILDFSANEFEEALGKGLHECRVLEEFGVGFNNLVGFLPNDLYNISSLLKLSAPVNRFSGVLNSDIGYLSHLTILSLHGNNFTGNLPLELGKLEKLEQLDLSSNQFSGWLPTSLSHCNKLQVINLRNNSLSGEINLDFRRFPDLTSLDLASNQLSGYLPPTLSNCIKIKSLSLSRNKLEGQIPESMTSLKSLTFFYISKNRLRNITKALQVFQDFKNLNTLILSKNFYEESVPEDTKGFKGLHILSLGNCALSGQFPSWLKNCSKLQLLDLSWNRLTGSIPPWIGSFQYLFYLDISNNSLSGMIPLELTKLPSLISEQNITDIDQNPLNLPLMIKHNENASGLQYNHQSSLPPAIYLSNNKLNGSIWSEFGCMKMLHILELRSNNLTGNIPDELSYMKNLESLDLSDNSLTGRIPTALQDLTFLSKFNVSNNHLEGLIPSEKQFGTFQESSFEGNPGLCGPPLPACNFTSSKPVYDAMGLTRVKRLNRNTILGTAVSVGVGFAFLLSALLLSLSKKHIKTEVDVNEIHCNMFHRISDASSVLLFQNHDIKDLTVADILKATNNFDQANIIGCGGFGLVYRATLTNGTKVAIKRLTEDCGQTEREFKAKVEALSRAQHKNLVSLQGYCRFGNCRLLIYSYMENGSLDYWLLERHDGGSMLDWPTRLRIAQGAGRGLAYLHRICDPHIVHRDIKSSNILLDEQFEAYIADFGISRSMLPYDTHMATELEGTLGYIAPQYGQPYLATLRGDVFNFGVVILELLTRRRPMEVSKTMISGDLVTWVQQMRFEGKQEEVFHPLLRGKGYEDQMLQVLDVACKCTNQNPFKRPDILEVVAWLEIVALDSQQI